MRAQDDLLEYYRRELAYLRVQSADFAARYPKVAHRLVLTGDEAADPHTEHLIQSVAYLNARVHRELERDFPTVAAAMLDNLCPSLTQPVPAMTVMQMALDPSEGKVTAGMPVKRGTMLSATAATGEQCRFQVGWNTILWPLRIGAIMQEDARTLRLDLLCEGGVDVAELELDTLRLHLSGDLLITMPLHELLISALEYIEVVGSAGVYRMSAHHLVDVGFAEDEALLARPAHVHPAYCLLQEYFAFPRKFQFFDLSGLRGRLGRGTGFSVRLVFTRSAAVLSQLRPENVLLGCVPALNLFPVTSEPIVLDRRHYEYLLIPDRRRDAVLEVHSIVSVSAADPRGERSLEIPSAFADAEPGAGGAEVCWSMRREASLRKGINGSDVYLGFVDRGDVRAELGEFVVYASLLCTNRLLAEQVAPGTRFRGDGVAASTSVRAVYQPSAQRQPALGNDALWALVGLLRLNHRSLADGSNGAATLREMLSLFAGSSARDQLQVRGIKRLHAQPATARLGSESWRGHCRGTDVTLEFDAAAFDGTSPLVLAGVLARFFAMYTTANSFVRLSVQRTGETWKQWPAMAGRQCLT
ncbi:type VI secretion protein [Duganella sp. Root198D2]|nr:type VI secretion protein [Duganella sp. Root336D2]KRB92477.1 type VI secretion protein [Duganella sp. Root198D2]